RHTSVGDCCFASVFFCKTDGRRRCNHHAYSAESITCIKETSHSGPEPADIYLPYLAVLPLIAVWSYLLDGLFIGATRAREMRNGMLLTVIAVLPVAWALQGLGNHGLWITFLLFMAVRSLTLLAIAWHLNRKNQWSSEPTC
ncbi:hypothetical protein, partial [Acinetobacter baumannii]|uniref:hypothetical protein n=1 Tax=Acinetobacter baumannii TaxID=470 RepID=UPI001D1756FF